MDSRIDALRRKLSCEQAALITGKPNIFYYSGFTSEDAVLIISHDRAMLVTDSRYTIQAKQQSPSFQMRDVKEGWETIFQDVSQTEILYEQEHLTVSRFEKFKNLLPKKEFVWGSKLLDSLRMCKDSGEAAKIREAERLGDEAFSHILKFIKAGKTEKEIAFELEFFMRKNGASGLSFEIIVASGVRSSMPHGVATDKTVEKGDFVTLDFGCVFEGYCSDMTRTVVVGECSDRQKEIYQTVLHTQTEIVSMLEKGKLCADIDKAARDIIASAGFGEYFRHGLGHGVGIEIHEMPFLSSKSDVILEAGHVVTVEPGIYIEGFGGVRIEDLVLICDEKTENLTHSSKELLII
ncbi:MAG: aminopeptidase P family protein [Clostridia bacterium]|nr:aminopeptidase P family protein [Clostridia bacterium]